MRENTVLSSVMKCTALMRYIVLFQHREDKGNGMTSKEVCKPLNPQSAGPDIDFYWSPEELPLCKGKGKSPCA